MARIKLPWEQKIDDERKAEEEIAIAKAKKAFVEKFVAASETERAEMIYNALLCKANVKHMHCDLFTY